MTPQKKDFLKGLSRLPSDFLASVLAWFISYSIRPFTDLIPGIHFEFALENLPPLEHFEIFTICSSFGLLIIFGIFSLYSSHPKSVYISSHTIQKICIVVGLWILGIVAVYSLWFHQLFFSRIMLLHAAIFTIFFSIFFRSILWIIWEKIFPAYRLAMVMGTDSEKKMLLKRLSKSSFHLTEEKTESASDVFFFEASHTDVQIREIRQWCAEKGKLLFLIPAYAQEFWGHASFEVIRGIPMICASPTPPRYWWFFWKRLFDIIISTVFLIILLPVFIIVAVAIRLESKGNVLYISKRVGRNGKLFPMIKFRSMYNNAEQQKKHLEAFSHRDGPLFKMKNDPRITKIGKWLRKTSIDEFPNFINVLLGHMSIIGPRPHLPNEVAAYTPDQKRVLSIRPGISGLAQVSGRSDLSFEQEMILETYYCEHMGFWLDMKIFFKTPFVLLFGKGAD